MSKHPQPEDTNGGQEISSTKRRKRARNQNVFSNPKEKILMKVSTWQKQSHGLYDYQSSPDRIIHENFEIKQSSIICRGNHIRRTYIKEMEDDTSKKLVDNFEVFELVYEAKTKKYTLNSLTKQPVSSFLYIKTSQYSKAKLFRSLISEPAKKNTHKLQPGDYLKLGRVELRVIEIYNAQKIMVIDYQQLHGSSKQFVLEMQQRLEGCCKVCLCEEQTLADPLVNPCLCKGSCGVIHLECLRNWINNKVKREMFGRVLTYNFQKFSCEICQAPFPWMIRFDTGEETNMLKFQKPDVPYILLEQCCQTEKKDAKTLHFVMPTEMNSVKIGRGDNCELNITDISVSRIHSEIQFMDNQFLLFDNNSKFGTLIQIREPIKIKALTRVQYDGCMIEIEPFSPSKRSKKISIQKIPSKSKQKST